MSNQPLDFVSLRAAYAEGLTPAELLYDLYRRIEAVGDPGIFLHLASEPESLAAAAALPPLETAADLPLWGLPFAVKDNIDVAGMPTTAGCPAFAYRPQVDAHCVARLRAAGAIPIGKTNLDQFATGLVGVRTPGQAPRNALDPEIVPGGSSSGSAVAVAQGLVSFALGTDTAGSGRVPAALNNIVGLKPSLGSVSNSGVVPACRTLDTVSVFALTVEDAYSAFAAAAGFDLQDPFARRLPLEPMIRPGGSLRLGVPRAIQREFYGDNLQAEAFEAALSQLAALGVELLEIDFAPFHAVAALLYDGPWVAERYTVIAELLNHAPDALHPTTRAVIEKAESFSAIDAFEAAYRLADLKRETERLTAELDGLCLPSIPRFYSCAELAADPIGPNSRLGTYTNFVNLLDLCGITVPVAARRDGRPGSVTLLAPVGQDHLIAGLAAEIHASAGVTCGATGWPVPPAPPAAAEVGRGEIALAVVGAHMRGLPLNGELTGQGARFLRRARTASCYRFYALPGGPPYRPGLVRTAEGAAIELEIWALPETQVGRLLARIPAPLGLGTVMLEDGSEVKGFLCESAGVMGARDITATGGWRAFLTAETIGAASPVRSTG
ncbi:MAG: allophanate hydrolase [Kiloniellales bacterium]